MAQITIINDSRGDVIAHKAGCSDIAKETKSHFAEVVYTADFDSERAVFLDYNEDFIDGDDESNCWPINFKPCCNLPKE